MVTVQNKKLKWGVYESPQCDDGVTFERYILETPEDVNKFGKAMLKEQSILHDQIDNIMAHVKDGDIVIATDAHPMSGFITYCFETKGKRQPDSHPSCFFRVN